MEYIPPPHCIEASPVLKSLHCTYTIFRERWNTLDSNAVQRNTALVSCSG